jgi:hypothetical protein
MILLPLAERIGPDTISKLEGAAPRRLEEAAVLERQGLLVGAVYLYGYVAEIVLGAAYFRMIGYRPEVEITPAARKLAIAQAQQWKLMSSNPHDIPGWARLVIATRKQRSQGYPKSFRDEIIKQAEGLYAQWRPGLRYRVTVPASWEVKTIRLAAEWFKQNDQRLWR